MPTPVTHLALAEEILRKNDLSSFTRRLLNQQRGSFLLGCTAPDVQTVSQQPRDETHFYTLPRTSDRPAYETLFAAHPALARPGSFSPERVAFIAGYIAHLLLDELWLDDVFLRYFWDARAARRERVFLHNVLRTWMDRQDRERLDDSVAVALQSPRPQGWLPFVGDEHLLAWRDWLIEQLGSGRGMQTAEVFAKRMGVPQAEMEELLKSPQRMEERVFCRIPRAALESFRKIGYVHNTSLIDWYVGQSAG